MVNELLGKVAVVTGAASGLGRGIALRFAAEGARVVIADVDVTGGEALATDLGPDAMFVRTDVSDLDQVGALVAATVAGYFAASAVASVASEAEFAWLQAFVAGSLLHLTYHRLRHGHNGHASNGLGHHDHGDSGHRH